MLLMYGKIKNSSKTYAEVNARKTYTYFKCGSCAEGKLVMNLRTCE